MLTLRVSNLFVLRRYAVLLSVMESREPSRDPFLRVSVSKVSGLVSVSKATGLPSQVLRLWILQGYGLVKLLEFNEFFLCYICRWETTKTGREMPEIRKNSTLKRWRQFFEKFRQNPQILKSRVSVLNFKYWIQVAEFFMKSRSRSFNEVSISKVMVSTSSLASTLKFSCFFSNLSQTAIWCWDYFPANNSLLLIWWKILCKTKCFWGTIIVVSEQCQTLMQWSPSHGPVPGREMYAGGATTRFQGIWLVNARVDWFKSSKKIMI